VELGLDPEKLSEEEWAKRYNEWVYVQQYKNEVQAKVYELAILRALSKAFSKE